MLTFREFIDICEVKVNPPNAVKGSIVRSDDGVIRYTLSDEPLKKPKNIQKELDRQGGTGGGAISKYLKKKVKKVQRIGEDVASQFKQAQLAYQSSPEAKFAERKTQLRQKQLDRIKAQKEKTIQYQQDSEERRDAQKDIVQQGMEKMRKKQEELRARREEERQSRLERQNQQEDIQLEQHPPGQEQNPYNVAIAKQQAARKRTREVHAQQEMGASARSQQRSHNAVLRAIMSRRTVG